MLRVVIVVVAPRFWRPPLVCARSAHRQLLLSLHILEVPLSHLEQALGWLP